MRDRSSRWLLLRVEMTRVDPNQHRKGIIGRQIDGRSKEFREHGIALIETESMRTTVDSRGTPAVEILRSSEHGFVLPTGT